MTSENNTKDGPQDLSDHHSWITQEPLSPKSDGSPYASRKNNDVTDLITQEPSFNDDDKQPSTIQSHDIIQSNDPQKLEDDDDGNNVDDWSMSTSSSSSSSSDFLTSPISQEDLSERKPDLAERRARNIQRNQEFLRALHLHRGLGKNRHYKDVDDSKSKNKNVNKRTNNVNDTMDNDGTSVTDCRMMTKMPFILQRIHHREYNSESSSSPEPIPRISMHQKYIHRHEQIRKLSSYLFLAGQAHTTAREQQRLPPIFITGPPGTGKTSIVREMLMEQQEQQQQRNSFVSYAYVDCQALDSPDNFAQVAYRTFYQSCKAETYQQQLHQKRSSKRSNGIHQDPLPPKNLSMRKGKDLLFKKEYHSTNSTGSSPLTTMADLGRRLHRLFGNTHCRHGIVITAAILVVDHAEVLLSSLGASTTSSINRLAQLLLLPRTTLGEHFPLTLVVITNSILLEYTGLNHLGSQWTISGHIVPLRIHFNAYHGKRILKEILCQERLKKLITGEQNMHGLLNHPAAGFYDSVYSSFIEILVQSMCDLTTDIREYLRIGRSLWPVYIKPCTPKNIHKTLQRAEKQSAFEGNRNVASLKREILLILDQNIFPRVRHALEFGIGSLEFDAPGTIDETNSHSTSQPRAKGYVPVFTDYLLLAAYVCQVNRPEMDKQIFSIQKNGRKRRRGSTNKDESASGTGEDVAFGSSFSAQNTVRARSFPMERLYSLYVSMMHLNLIKNIESENRDDDFRSLGTSEFDCSVAFLISIGILHEYPSHSSTETKRLSQRSVWSSITKAEAQAAAKRVNFPLDRYTL